MSNQLTNAALGIFFATSTLTASAQPKSPKPAVVPLSKECITEATKIFTQINAFHDGKHKSVIPTISGDELARIEQSGEVRGKLSGGSTLTPSSSYVLVVLPGSSAATPEQSCPLHRTYVRFIQGGFNPQAPIYYGPLRAGAG